MTANIEQIKAMLERTGKTNLLQKPKVDLDKERHQLEAMESRNKTLEQAAKEDAEHYFPELKESEDERIRKELLEHCINRRDGKQVCVDASDYRRWADWLEKQKPANEPKFKVGDWLILLENHNSVYQIERIDNYRYYLRHYLGGTLSQHFDSKIIRQWTIQDAKPGDVLNSLDSNKPFIYKYRNANEQATCYCGINKLGKFFIWNTKDCIITLDKYVPATKEQRDLLFQKMREAGYEWLEETHKLKKIEQKPAEDWIEKRMKECPFRKADGCERYADVISECTGACSWVVDYPKLKEIQDRQEQKPAEWSKNDTAFLNEIIDFFENKTVKLQHDLDMYAHWLKSLPERFNF